MFKRTVLSGALTLAFACPSSANAADDAELAQLRNEVRQMKENYEARIRALEQRLQAAQAGGTEPSAAQMSAAPAAASASTKRVAAAEAPATAPPYPAASAIAAGEGGGGGFKHAVSLK